MFSTVEYCHVCYVQETQSQSKESQNVFLIQSLQHFLGQHGSDPPFLSWKDSRLQEGYL